MPYYLIVLFMLIEIFMMIRTSLMTKNWFSIENLIIFSFLILYSFPIFFLDEAWVSDDGFLFLLAIGNVGLIFSILLFSQKLKVNYFEMTEKVPIVFNERFALFLTMISLGYLLIELFLAKAYNPAHVIHLLTSDRVSEYLSSAADNSSGTFDGLFKTIIFIMIAYHWKHKFWLGNLIWFLYFFLTAITSHTRFVIIIVALFPVLYYNYQVKPIKMKTLLAVGLFSLVFITIGNYARGGLLGKGDSRFTFSQILKWDNMMDQLFRASAGSTRRFRLLFRSDFSYDFFKQYYYYLPISFIPRAVWANKPIVSYFWRVTKAITGSYPSGKNNPVLTTTYLGEAYHQIGMLGVFLMPIIYLWLLLFFFKVYRKFQYSELIIYATLLHIPLDLRGGFNSFVLTNIPTLMILFGFKWFGCYYKKENITLI